ncbi:MAG: helix-turn-helix domain-containing protein [Alteromonadaceae bacterium]|nr:helix-turn-helix domain-containing protein [Alteromonadaceae bacterium]
MDQTELAKRVGLSRSTISLLERGVGVNSQALFDVLSFLEISDLLQVAIDERLELVEDHGSRKARKIREELSNDF